MNRRRLVACILLVLACRGHDETAAQSPRGAPAPTDVVATVGDSPIFRAELDAVVRRAAGLSQLQGLEEGATTLGPGRQRWLQALAIEQLVDERLLRAEIRREQITVGRLDVDTRLEQLRKQVAARGVDWDRFLAQTGRDESVVREQIELEIALDRLIRPRLTQAVVEAGLERHKRAVDGTQLRVSHILLRPDAALGEEGLAEATARAAAIRREVLQGSTSFAEAARRHSAAPSRVRGGDLGWIKRNAPFIDTFGRRAFELAKGDISKPFMTPFGIHIVEVTDIQPGRMAMEILRPKLETLVAADVLKELLTRLRGRSPVTYGPGVAHFDPATPADGDGPRRILVGEAAPRSANPAGP